MRSALRVTRIALATLFALLLGGQTLPASAQDPRTAGQQGDSDKDKQESAAEAAQKTQSPDGAVPAEGDSSKTDRKADGKAPVGSKPTEAKAKRDSVSSSGVADKKGKPSRDAKSTSISTSRTDAKVDGRSQKSAPSEPSSPASAEASLQNVAKETLLNLDTAIMVAKNAQVRAPAAWPSQAPGGDPFLAKRTELQQSADAAKDAQAWVGVATQAAAALSDVLKATANSAANSRPAAPDSKRPFAASSLPLYLAGLSFAVSLLALWTGWFVARREINKALVEAGLL